MDGTKPKESRGIDVEKSVDDGLVEKHVRIEWNRPVTSLEEAKVQWSILDKEAKSVLNMVLLSLFWPCDSLFIMQQCLYYEMLLLTGRLLW